MHVGSKAGHGGIRPEEPLGVKVARQGSLPKNTGVRGKDEAALLQAGPIFPPSLQPLARLAQSGKQSAIDRGKTGSDHRHAGEMLHFQLLAEKQ